VSAFLFLAMEWIKKSGFIQENHTVGFGYTKTGIDFKSVALSFVSVKLGFSMDTENLLFCEGHLCPLDSSCHFLRAALL
jgi:hypothetical protein